MHEEERLREERRLHEEGRNQIFLALDEYHVIETRPDLTREWEFIPGQGTQERVSHDWVIQHPGWLLTPLGRQFLDSDPLFATSRRISVVTRLREPERWDNAADIDSEDSD